MPRVQRTALQQLPLTICGPFAGANLLLTLTASHKLRVYYTKQAR